MQMSFTPAAKTLDVVQFDQYHQGFDMAAVQGPQMAQIGQIMSFVYSQDGMNIYSASSTTPPSSRSAVSLMTKFSPPSPPPRPTTIPLPKTPA